METFFGKNIQLLLAPLSIEADFGDALLIIHVLTFSLCAENRKRCVLYCCACVGKQRCEYVMPQG